MDSTLMEAMHHQRTPFGEMIHEERVGRGMSIARAAKQAGVRGAVWRRWEAGTNQPTKVQLRRAFGEHCQLQQYLPVRASEAPPSGAPSAWAPASPTATASTGAVTELHDLLGALDRVVRALEALGQSVVQSYFMPGADGAWEFVVRPNDDPPLAVGVRASDPAVVRHALVGLRAGMATRHAQAEPLASVARLEALAGTLAAIDGALLAA